MEAPTTISSSIAGSPWRADSTSPSTEWRCFAASRSRRPQSVGVTPREERRRSVRPHSSSRAWTCAVTAGCDRWRSFAALEIFRVCATTRKVSSLRGSIRAMRASIAGTDG